MNKLKINSHVLLTFMEKKETSLLRNHKLVLYVTVLSEISPEEGLFKAGRKVPFSKINYTCNIYC